MKTVTLKPNNQRMKRLINDHGETWRLINTGPKVCFNNQMGALIENLAGGKLSNVLVQDVIFND